MLAELTVAIPTYNRNDYLQELLDTIPANFPGSVIVNDNGNFVNDSIKSKYGDFRFISLVDKIEMFANWNSVIASVDTEWFILPSDDDLFYPNSFKFIEEELRNNPDGDIFIFGYNVIDENGQILNSWNPEKAQVLNSPDGFKVFLKGVDGRCPSIIFRTEFAKKMGNFDESFIYTAADSLLIQKCLLYGKSVFVQKIISGYRTWPNNLTTQLISTTDWLNKVEQWTSIIAGLLQKDFSSVMGSERIINFKDEIYARNLLSGIKNKRGKEGILSALQFFMQSRFPFHADLNTRLRIIKAIVSK